MGIEGQDQFVFVQNGEPGGLYCADETDGEALRVCEQISESLLATRSAAPSRCRRSPRAGSRTRTSPSGRSTSVRASRSTTARRSTPTTSSRATASSGTPPTRATSAATATSSTGAPCSAGFLNPPPPRRAETEAPAPETRRSGDHRRRLTPVTPVTWRRAGTARLRACSPLAPHRMIRFVIHRFSRRSRCSSGSSSSVFVLARVIPGDPCTAALGERATDAGLRRVQRNATGSTGRSPCSSSSTSATCSPATSASRSASAASVVADPHRAPARPRSSCRSCALDVRHHRRRAARRASPPTGATRRSTSARWSPPTSASRCRSSCSA